MPPLRVGAAQINAVVGDIDGNLQRAIEAYESAVAARCVSGLAETSTITARPSASKCVSWLNR